MSIIPVYDFSPELNADYLKKIVPLITKHNIAVNPINYAIFYDYVSEKHPGLTQAVDEYLKAHKPFDCDNSLELYGRYICDVSLEPLEKINRRIQTVISQVNDSISDTIGKAEESSDRFRKKKEILDKISESAPIEAVLQEIIQETMSLVVSSQTLQTRLNLANTQMEQLRTELAQVREIAVTDGLTGLLNRRAFDQSLADIIQSSAANNICLSMLDIDHFKRVNDTYGHTIGDKVIQYVASLLKKHALEHHYVARYGGEELAIIMPDTSKQQAMAISENIRVQMEKSNLRRKADNTPLGTITISIGVAELKDGDNSESFISRADKALYQAKESGRNKVMLS